MVWSNLPTFFAHFITNHDAVCIRNSSMTLEMTLNDLTVTCTHNARLCTYQSFAPPIPPCGEYGEI